MLVSLKEAWHTNRSSDFYYCQLSENKCPMYDKRGGMKIDEQQRGINPQRLDYFEGAMLHGSISVAANNMNTSSSVMTRQIQILARELEQHCLNVGHVLV